MSKVNLTGMNLAELEAFVGSLGERRFRARQLFSWIYGKGTRSFDEMTDLSKGLRARLKDIAVIGGLAVTTTERSREDGTTKFLFELEDGERIEAVWIPEEGRRTVCISTQVGCPVDCGFCATGMMGFRRQLTAGEIIDQLLAVRRTMGEPITNVVVMGMGEPFLNYDQVIKACTLATDPNALNIGHRKIVISTSGFVPAIRRFADEGQKFKLAISLNATTDEDRRRLMPAVAKKYPLSELFSAAQYYVRRSRRRVTFEYVLLEGINDRAEDARRLHQFLQRLPCKLNLIPYNPTRGHFQRPSEERILAFYRLLEGLPAVVSIRWSKGSDIDAACGQLYVETARRQRAETQKAAEPVRVDDEA